MEQSEESEKSCGEAWSSFSGYRWLPRVIKSTLKKLHANLGHPGKDDMKRSLRNAGVENEMIEAVDWMKCGACPQSQRPRVHRASKLPPSDARFNDRVMVDCCQIKDVRGKGFWSLCILDWATMYQTVGLIQDHSPKSLLEVFRNNWMNTFGPPEELTIDQERGFIGPLFSDTLQEMGVKVTSIAGQAHWQHGQIERHIGILKDMMSRAVKHTQTSGPEQMEIMCRECTQAKNSLIREHGFSPEQLVFGHEVRREGELWANGELVAYHHEVGDKSNYLARMMKYRYEARKAFVESHASSLLERTARNRTKSWKEPQIGVVCFFYRENRKTKDKGVVSGWVGPAYVVGLQGNGNAWVTMGGRSYLVAPEMCREAVGEELFGRPEIQRAVAVLKNHKNGVTYRDLRGQSQPSPETLDQQILRDGSEDSEAEEQPDVKCLRELKICHSWERNSVTWRLKTLSLSLTSKTTHSHTLPNWPILSF